LILSNTAALAHFWPSLAILAMCPEYINRLLIYSGYMDAHVEKGVRGGGTIGTGAYLRLLECLRLRVKDMDVASHQILLREGKGQKDRRTMLPAAVHEPLRVHLEYVRQRH
jgi:hypothetical protein